MTIKAVQMHKADINNIIASKIKDINSFVGISE
jgi:hypothetical protein